MGIYHEYFGLSHLPDWWWILVIAGVTVKAYVVDLASETLDPTPYTIRAYFIQTVSDFKNLVSQVSHHVFINLFISNTYMAMNMFQGWF